MVDGRCSRLPISLAVLLTHTTTCIRGRQRVNSHRSKFYSRGKNLKHRRACRERRGGEGDTSSIYGNWIRGGAFRVLRSHYKADVAGFCKARGHAHPFQTGCTLSPYAKKLVAKTIGQSFSEYSFLRELEGSTPLAERGFGTVPAQCPRSARTVPATVPAWES